MILPRRKVVLRVALTALLVAFLHVDAAGQVPIPGQGTSRPRAEEKQVQLDASLPVFEFHSGFWINLHHFLYQQARIQAQLPTSEPEAAAGMTTHSPSTKNLTAEEYRAWSEAVAHYRETLAAHDLQFDGDMVAMKNQLAELEAAPNMQQSGLRPELIAALERAAPIYRAYWWQDHDRTNRVWIANVAPLVRQFGAKLAEQLATVYRARWPGERIRVDVTSYAGRLGGYTSLTPLHITISSGEPRNQGPAALEVLFHEASHALASEVMESIARECRARRKPIPRELWHALLFYTTGEVVRRAFGGTDGSASATLGNYTPYAYRYGLYTRGWQNFQRLLERHWQPYLDGVIEFDRALARLVTAL